MANRYSDDGTLMTNLRKITVLFSVLKFCILLQSDTVKQTVLSEEGVYSRGSAPGIQSINVLINERLFAHFTLNLV